MKNIMKIYCHIITIYKYIPVEVCVHLLTRHKSSMHTSFNDQINLVNCEFI